MAFVSFNPSEEKSKESKFLKIEEKTKIRFLTGMVEYTRNWPTGAKKHRMAVVQIPDGSIRYFEVKASMLPVLSEYEKENGDPAGQMAPTFAVSHNGQAGMARRWTIIPGSKPAAYPDVQRKALEKDLLDFCNNLENKKDE